MFKRLFAAGLVFGMAALAPPVFAQSNCAPRDVVTKQLTQKFGEVSQGGGLQSQARIYELWSSQVTGSWSILVTNTSGMTCVLATGNNWTPNPEYALAFDPAA